MIHSLSILSLVIVTASPADDSFFESKIRPVLVGTCVRCHNAKKASGGLRLDSREALLRGGKSGRVVAINNTEDSLLLEAVRRSDDVAPMPPEKPLSASVVNDLKHWIDAGVPWPDQGKSLQSARHWAFEPVRTVIPPVIAGLSPRQPIDLFLAHEQQRRGVIPAGPADKRTLIRRATFDLLGLPPTPDEVDSFLLDETPTAFETVIDRLLASPHYGEKWGRLWLDVAHYADTAGETADFPVPDAWRYRNYVINALNSDKPYDQFLREQIAGDLYASELPDDAPSQRYEELITATGYLAIARRFGFDTSKDHYLTIDDAIDTLGKSVLGLTIACARCHDHKYDPVSAEDYYALYGIFDSTRYPFSGCEKERVPRDTVPLFSKTEFRRQIEPLKARVAAAESSLAKIEERVKPIADQPGVMVATGDIPNGDLHTQDAVIKIRKGEMLRLAIAPKSGHGADSTLIDLKIKERGGAEHVWDVTRDFLADAAQGNSGRPYSATTGTIDAWHAWNGGSPPKLLTVLEKDAERTQGLLCWKSDKPWPCAFINVNDQPVQFMTVKQPARSLALHPGPTEAAVLGWTSPIDAEVSIQIRVQDIDNSAGDGVAWSLSTGPNLGSILAETIEPLNVLNRARRDLDRFVNAVPTAYAVAEGQPHDARIYIKGDPETLGPVVPRRFLEVLGGQSVTSGSGRRELAGWITDPKNPLTARVMVNRVWQGHFGNGLVRTPDNFGVRGEPPTHPDLLDWLAGRFVADGWSLKKLHRQIMTTDAYRRESVTNARSEQIDPENVTLWRFPGRRLAAEEIRDAMLVVSGDLDMTPAEAHPFPPSSTWKFTQHEPFTAVYDHNRRSIYLMTQRIKRHPFLALFDGPDPNSCTGRRDSTTVPTQALFVMNDPFVHARAASVARNLARLDSHEVQIDRAWRTLYGRPPLDHEIAIARRFFTSSNSGMNGWIRVMLASNEFIYVE